MKFNLEKTYAILKIEEKSKVDLYHLIDLHTGDKVTALGVKSEEKLNQLDVATVILTMSVNTEMVGTGDNKQYLQVAKIFVSEIRKVKV